MKRLLTLLLLCFSLSYTTFAQLPDGSIAPDFTVTDLDGNEINLYEILDEGKSVILDLSATWCGPCWSLHQSGLLDEIYEEYGPDGMDEIYVLYVEADPRTSIADILGTGTNTIGDWTEGVNYPIANDDNIGDLYNLQYFPTVYHICSNRITTEMGRRRGRLSSYLALSDQCMAPKGDINVGVLKHDTYEGAFCQEESTRPTVTLQNLGAQNVSSVEVDFLVNGQVVQSKTFNSILKPFDTGIVSFSRVNLTETSELSFVVNEVNGMADEDLTNNELTFSALKGSTDQNVLDLKITTDEFPFDNYWELLDENENVLYTGGNAGVFSGAIADGAYTQPNAEYSTPLILPKDGCYALKVYDLVEDGFAEGAGFEVQYDGDVIINGGQFDGTSKEYQFELSGASTIENNGSIVVYSGSDGQFCGEMDFRARVTMLNVGNSDIEKATFEVKDQDNQVLQEFEWTAPANFASGETRRVTFSPITVDRSAELTISVASVNGEADTYAYQNSVNTSVERAVELDKEFIEIELLTDGYGYEMFWEITDGDGSVVDFGGNSRVGANGGGRQVATPNDFGAYGNSQTITKSVEVFESSCYQIRIVDDYGDGFTGTGYFRVRDADGNLLYEVTGGFTTEDRLVDVQLNPLSNKTLDFEESVQLLPNPASDQAVLSFELAQSRQLDIALYNALGQRIQLVSQAQFVAGQHQLEIATAHLAEGIYLVAIQDGEQQRAFRLVVNH